MNYLIVMPVTHWPSARQCLDSMDTELVKKTLLVDNTVNNHGAASSYNMGAEQLLTFELDWLITLSPSTRFGPKSCVDLIDYLTNVEGSPWVVEAEMPVGWHLIAWNRQVFTQVGLWDENFWPVYGEDADISHRIITATNELGLVNSWHVTPVDAWITMQGHSSRIGGVNTSNQETIWAYYTRKWGGRSGHEKYVRPFGNKPLSYWEKK